MLNNYNCCLWPWKNYKTCTLHYGLTSEKLKVNKSIKVEIHYSRTNESIKLEKDAWKNWNQLVTRISHTHWRKKSFQSYKLLWFETSHSIFPWPLIKFWLLINWFISLLEYPFEIEFFFWLRQSLKSSFVQCAVLIHNNFVLKRINHLKSLLLFINSGLLACIASHWMDFSSTTTKNRSKNVFIVFSFHFQFKRQPNFLSTTTTAATAKQCNAHVLSPWSWIH